MNWSKIQDTKKLQEFCCGINVWSEKAAEIFNIKEEDKEAFLSDPKLKAKEEYPDWLWDPELLIDINKLSLEDIDPDKNPELYWKKVKLQFYSSKTVPSWPIEAGIITTVLNWYLTETNDAL